MIISIDRAGRVVLPKPLREQYNLHAGSRLEITTGSNGMELKPIEVAPSMVKVSGLWVHRGVPQDVSINATDAVQQARDERINSLTSLVIRKKH